MGVRRARAMNLTQGARFFRDPQTQKRGPFGPRFRIHRRVGGGLGDDERSLSQSCDGDRREEDESSGEVSDLGHFHFPEGLLFRSIM